MSIITELDVFQALAVTRGGPPIRNEEIDMRLALELLAEEIGVRIHDAIYAQAYKELTAATLVPDTTRRRVFGMDDAARIALQMTRREEDK